MESKNARFLREGMLETCRKMKPAQRVRAFIEQSLLLKRINKVGASRLVKSPLRKKSFG